MQTQSGRHQGYGHRHPDAGRDLLRRQQPASPATWAASYLGQAAIAKFGADKVKEGYFILGDLPQSGAIPTMRTDGQLAGFLAAVKDFPEPIT